MAAFVTSPLDLAKLRMQIGTSNLGMTGSLKSIYYQEGVRGLFQGAGARVSQSISIYIHLYYVFKFLNIYYVVMAYAGIVSYS